jgi:thiamine biosynthesis lipoprotein
MNYFYNRLMKKSVKKIFTALGTVNTIDVPSCPNENILTKATDRVTELHRRFSAFEADSDVSRINENAGLDYVPVHSDTVFLLKQAARYSKASGGAFAISVRPLVRLWGFGETTPAVPDARKISSIRKLVNWRDILINADGSAVKLRRLGQAIDLGGIAKGYALDEVRRILTDGGITDAVINLGGSVAVLGSPMYVGIQHPDRPTGGIMGRIQLSNACAVTSGSYEKYIAIGSERYHHIIDPRTGRPSTSGVLSVTLIGKDALTLDALSTAVFVLGAEKGAPLIAAFGLKSVIVDDDRNVFVSESLKDDFKLNQEVHL